MGGTPADDSTAPSPAPTPDAPAPEPVPEAKGEEEESEDNGSEEDEDAPAPAAKMGETKMKPSQLQRSGPQMIAGGDPADSAPNFQTQSAAQKKPSKPKKKDTKG